MNESDPGESATAREQGLAPVWRVGDTWFVRYRVQEWGILPKRANPGAPPIVTYDSRYRVDDIQNGLVTITATPVRSRDEGHWTMEYEQSGRIVSIVDEFAIPVQVPERGPMFPLAHRPAREHFVKDWPCFPIEEPFEEREGALSQRAIPAAGALDVSLARVGHDHGTERRRTMVQRWERGRPWWSSVVIRRFWQDEDGAHEKIEIEGTVIEWPGGEPRDPGGDWRDDDRRQPVDPDDVWPSDRGGGA